MFFYVLVYVTFLDLAFFSYASDSGFLLVCAVLLAKSSSNSLALIMSCSSKRFHSVSRLREREVFNTSPSVFIYSYICEDITH